MLDYKTLAATARMSNRGWFDRLDEKSKKALLSVRTEWQKADEAGKAPPAMSFAEGLHKACFEQGLIVPRKKGLAEWLRLRS